MIVLNINFKPKIFAQIINIGMFKTIMTTPTGNDSRL